MAFEKGKSGNPAGKPKGARNKVTLAIEALLDGEAEALTRKAVEIALNGSATNPGAQIAALRLCLERLAPPRKDRPIPFALPALETPGDAVKAYAALAAAVAEGELTPSEAGDFSRLIEGYTRAVEIADIDARLRKLEAEKG